MKFNKLLNSILMTGVVFGCNAFAQTAVYDAATRNLSIPSVQAGDRIYSNLVVRIDSMAVISVGSSSPVGSVVAEQCVDANFTTSAYNAITENMTVDQVNRVMGCKFDPTMTLRSTDYIIYVWYNSRVGAHALLTVYFDPNGARVTSLNGPGGIFKISSGF